MPQFRIKLSGQKRVLKVLKNRDERLKQPLTKLFDQIGELWVKFARDHIRQGGPPGRPFRPLKPTTIRLRGGTSTPLLDSGALLRSIGAKIRGRNQLRVGPTRDFPKVGLQFFGGVTSKKSAFPGKFVIDRNPMSLTPDEMERTVKLASAFFAGEDAL